MNFKEAYKAMQEGKKVRIKTENGYFYYRKNMKRIYHHISEKCFDLPTEEIAIENVLSNDWEVVEEEKKYWKPKESEGYYFIDAYQEGIGNDTNDGTDVDDFRLSIGNYFKTKEEAEHMVEKLKVIHELQKFAYENNEKEIDLYDDNQYKYILKYDTNDDDIFVGAYTSFIINPFDISFTSEEIALKAIETIGADRIKKYYFGVE